MALVKGRHIATAGNARRRSRRRRGPLVALVVVAAVVAGAVLGIRALISGGVGFSGPACSAVSGTTTYRFDYEQATNASTIAAVAKRLGLPDHAVTVGLATALQESKLRNLDYGDLDSLGLFQQRPSQGWGTAAQILNPSYAATAFFEHLAQVPGWQTMSVAEAAQAVQHSAAGSAYTAWEPQARVMAETLTGEVPAGFACHIQVKDATAADQAVMVQAATSELGPVDWAGSVSSPLGWVVASWLIGHAQQYQVSSVSYAGWKWTARGGRWTADSSATTHIAVNG